LSSNARVKEALKYYKWVLDILCVTQVNCDVIITVFQLWGIRYA